MGQKNWQNLLKNVKHFTSNTICSGQKSSAQYEGCHGEKLRKLGKKLGRGVNYWRPTQLHSCTVETLAIGRLGRGGKSMMCQMKHNVRSKSAVFCRVRAVKKPSNHAVVSVIFLSFCDPWILGMFIQVT